MGAREQGLLHADGREGRRECADRYKRLLAPLAGTITPPVEHSWSRSVFHLYVVRYADRKELQAYLGTRNIGTGIHYPIPLHLQTAYKGRGYKEGDFPVSETVSCEILSLPMYPQLTSDQQYRVAEAISELVEKQDSVALAS